MGDTMLNKTVIEEAKRWIVEQNREKAVELAKRVIAEGGDPLELMNQGFIPGINAVGDLFGRGQLFLPELMQAADTMKAATDIVNETLAERGIIQRQTAATVLIATVKGDVHDIGKCIVVSLFKANGFTVYDLGRDVPTEKIIEEAVKHNVDIIGTSALLTTTMNRQKELEETLKKAGLRDRFKTMVGGAPVTPRWAARIGADAYAEDAQDGVVKLKALLLKNP
jgi:corrinoid protein of di/trimethylamine methyltransferase